MIDIVASERAAERTIDRCRQIARCSERADCVARTFCSNAMRQAHDLLRHWMRQSGLRIRVDNAGNLIGRHSGAGDRRVLLIGSHLDSVVNAGMYDGVLGVLTGLAVAELVSASQERLPFAIDVVAFSEEEGVRFQTPYLGSLALVGELTDALLSRRDQTGISIADALHGFGCDVRNLAACQYDPAHVVGYVEPHIEQGPVLELQDLPVGVVEGIFGQTRALFRLNGRAGHAGTVPMRERRDALAAAAEIVLVVERVGRNLQEGVATVGRLEVAPNVGNVIAGEVRLRLDLRHLVDEARQSAFLVIRGQAQRICDERKIELLVEQVDEQPATPCDRRLVELLANATKEDGIRPLRMPSGAGHDAVPLARRFPVGMLFVRSAGGVSHHPDETVEARDVAAAIRVLRRTVSRLGALEFARSNA